MLLVPKIPIPYCSMLVFCIYISVTVSVATYSNAGICIDALVMF